MVIRKGCKGSTFGEHVGSSKTNPKSTGICPEPQWAIWEYLKNHIWKTHLKATNPNKRPNCSPIFILSVQTFLENTKMLIPFVIEDLNRLPVRVSSLFTLVRDWNRIMWAQEWSLIIGPKIRQRNWRVFCFFCFLMYFWNLYGF